MYGQEKLREIQRFMDEGNGFRACHEKFGIAHATWKAALHRGDLVLPYGTRVRDIRRKYDWTEIQAYYDDAQSYRQTRDHFGFSNAAWYKAVERGEITLRENHPMPIEELLRGPRQRAHVKARLLKAGILKNECSRCGLLEWRGRPLMMHLDHINGIKDDHRLENLRMLCPNCHSQTDTYGGRNLRLRRRLQDDRPSV